MKKLTTLLLVLAMCLPAMGTKPIGTLRTEAEMAEHQMGIGEGMCSGSAIAPHAFLTAAHCLHEMEVPAVVFDGDKPAKVEHILEDDNDHVILLVSGVTFQNTIPYHTHTPTVGEKVFYFGNAAAIGLKDLYREGYFAGLENLPTEGDAEESVVFQAFMMPVVPGDSGSVILNEQGDIVGVVSIGWNVPAITGAFPLQFTRTAILMAESY